MLLSGFRPGRGTRQALEAVREALGSGRMSVYDADLQGYFDSIPARQADGLCADESG